MIGMKHSTHNKLISMKNDKKRSVKPKELQLKLDPSDLELENDMMIAMALTITK